MSTAVEDAAVEDGQAQERDVTGKPFVSLARMIAAGDGPIGRKERVYRFTYGEEVRFVRSNSPGAAALACCEVELVDRGDVYDAAMEELHRSRKAKGPSLDRE